MRVGLFILSVLAVGMLWLHGFRRRLAAAKARRERLLWQLHYLAVADAMTWKQFENYGVE